ncbi:MAG: ATPase, T2SS/T4P/T4SS family [Planctomycetota bacterium]
MQITDAAKPAHSDARVAVGRLLGEAVARRASDLHFEPTALGYDINFRIDGLIETRQQVSPQVGQGLVNRLMVGAKLLTYRRNIPQEGRYTVPAAEAEGEAGGGVGARDLDLRVSVMPTNHGLRAAVRLPADLRQPRRLDELGLPEAVVSGLIEFARGDNGMLLLTGPAGSGKTTTIYALLEAIRRASEGISIVALEDPIERDLPGVTQVQVTPFGELTYDRALRSMLRQDPQVLALGEIRDADTASAAVQASLSGHRLVSTLHAASPAGAVARLLEMGLERYQVAGALWGVVSLRLLRRSDGKGGYRGRVPVASLGRMDDAVRSAVVAGAGLDEIQSLTEKQAGFTSFRAAAQRLVDRSETDDDEVCRVLGGGETNGR